jgi:2-succinyl-6-hydroxy-2,4-cyclohexadiene-1-carboxylate synthase
LGRLGSGLETGIVFIHGFLGAPSDWDQVAGQISAKPLFFVDLNSEFEVVDLNFQAWPKAFKNWLKKKKISVPVKVVGYSMGGRLALPLLDQGLVQSAILLSSHLGFPELALKERTERRLENQKWSEKFLNDDWEKVIKDWNDQEVFKDSTHEPKRLEQNYNRTKLAAMLTGFSLSDQKDYSQLFKTRKSQIAYLVGNKDKKYGMLALKFMRDFPAAKIEIIQNSGHRMIFDQPQSVAEKLIV